MTSTLPQHSYFTQEYSIPSLTWKISGHSRALERTGFLLYGGGRILLDAGIDIPDFTSPDIILLTHSHIDHCNALPMLYRLTRLIIFFLFLVFLYFLYYSYISHNLLSNFIYFIL